ncbi:MAG: hypothetical protein EDM05_011100 [Leptolyngbya sp. IPPAS B-1204]
MFFILIVVIGLVAWALHLMQEAIQHREFSLMLAGFLVSTAAAGMMAVYFLMSHYVGYMSEMAHRSYGMTEWSAPIVWSTYGEDWLSAGPALNPVDYRSN